MQTLTLNLGQGSVSFPLSPDAARELRATIADLMNLLKQSASAKSSDRAQPKPPMEYRQVGPVFLELFCNPNIWPSPFAAKVLLTLRSEQIRLSTEIELSRLVEDLEQYLEQVG